MVGGATVVCASASMCLLWDLSTSNCHCQVVIVPYNTFFVKCLSLVLRVLLWLKSCKMWDCEILFPVKENAEARVGLLKTVKEAALKKHKLQWFSCFKNSELSLADRQSGQPLTSQTDKKTMSIHELILKDCHRILSSITRMSSCQWI